MRGRESDEDQCGVIPRCIKQLLDAKSVVNTIYVSYLQLYCELITDLLLGSGGVESDSGATASQLYIREANNRVYVQGLSKCVIRSMEEFYQLLETGDRHRVTASTNMNETSSRSHAVMIVTITSEDLPPLAAASSTNTALKSSSSSSGGSSAGGSPALESTLYLVDLAGSERAAASANRAYMRGEEAKAINLSLSALGNCISALCDRKAHIPFRDSKLTRLLQVSGTVVCCRCVGVGVGVEG